MILLLRLPGEPSTYAYFNVKKNNFKNYIGSTIICAGTIEECEQYYRNKIKDKS